MKPILKLYRGYANEQELIVMGHVFLPTNKKDYDFLSKKFKNATATINMFRIKTHANATVYLEHHHEKIETKTLDDGYFKFCIPLKEDQYGWIDYTVSILYNNKTITCTESYNRPKQGDLGIISDIDDTLIISYTRSPIKKIYHLLFKNVHKRKIFDDVALHYQALSAAGREDKLEKNIFFYVSSSEWNLYRLIIKFAELHQLPKAVLLLKDIKTSLTQFFWSFKQSHNHKYEKIKHILEFYPQIQYVLLGDDSQKDAYLYEVICKIFPLSVKAIYIRQTGKSKKNKIAAVLENIATLDVAVCYFEHSAEAIAHSKKIGIIN
ncbi:App1 family protein [Flavobacterium algicola]|uniref:App1 family protein n=1 Tax=Flavobacterium algicola TaxID=556529 RepID=UPI001EFCCA41|nr:App1 family protein [Flavobacterium algicola]MCG9791317.1 App1 family protein [Flavobacterium algicola]